MITYTDFPYHTRLGNKLFNYAFMLGCEKKYNQELILPDYYLWKYLKNPPKIGNEKGEVTFHFRHDGYDPEYVDEFFEKNRSVNINLTPCGQSERWWEHCVDYVKERLEFKQEEIDKVKKQYDFFDKETIGLSIRLGKDYKGDMNFYQVPNEWYINAISHFFDWHDYNIVVFSDNINEAKEIFKDYNFKYAEPNNTHIRVYDQNNFHQDPTNHLILGSLMDNFIIGISTFSWWQAYLSKSDKIICTGKNFENHYKKIMKNKDYYPERFIVYQ